MPKSVKRAVVLGIMLVAPQLGIVAPQRVSAQDREFPVLNSLGRYLGVGYTRAGYHAANDGRFDVVTQLHPASDYRRGGLPMNSMSNFGGAPIVQGWQPPPTAAVSNSSTPAAQSPATGKATPGANEKPSPNNERSSSKPVAPELIETPKPIAPPKPSGPPPSWLQDYLKDEEEASSKATNSPKDSIELKELEIDSSPSDLFLEESDGSLFPALGVTYTIMETSFPSFSPAPSVPSKSSAVNRYNVPSYRFR